MNSSVKSMSGRKMAAFLLLKSLAVGKRRRTWVHTQLCLHKAWCKHVTCSACSSYVTSIIPCLHNLLQSPTSFVLIIYSYFMLEPGVVIILVWEYFPSIILKQANRKTCHHTNSHILGKSFHKNNLFSKYKSTSSHFMTNAIFYYGLCY